MSPLTISYLTNRREPYFEWFFDSLANQCAPSDQPVIVVDFYADDEPRRQWVKEIAARHGFPVTHVSPKPSLWQGKHKITRFECFDAGNARNTALCLCQTMFIAWADDVSVLMPGWYREAMLATTRNAWTFGSYRKAFDMDVVSGNLVHLRDNPIGHDNRRAHVGSKMGAAPCPPEWLFGCSLVAPVEAVLDLGRWPERLCAGTGYEDGVMALLVKRARHRTFFAPMMFSVESEEAHHVDLPFKRWDPCIGETTANPKNDKSHAMMDWARKNATNSAFNGYDIRELRSSVLGGAQFPVPTGPTDEWFTGKPISELDFQ